MRHVPGWLYNFTRLVIVLCFSADATSSYSAANVLFCRSEGK